MRPIKILRLSISIAIAAALVTPITSSAPAAATTPACAPTYLENSPADYLRTYIFSTVGTCVWTAPGAITVNKIAIVGGGGGGGGGNYGGNGGAGGGGGGGAYYQVSNYTYIAAGQQITITVGAGGAAGQGATVLNTDGASGGTGGNSKFGDFIATGGGGGGGGTSSNGGSGGGSGYRNGLSGEAKSGGGQWYGAGGGGASYVNQGANASNAGSNSAPGGVTTGVPFDRGFQYLSTPYFGSGGPGGAPGTITSLAGGGTISRAPTTPVVGGNGGSGGHGCSSSEQSCVNQNGTEGSSGIVLLSFFAMLNYGEKAAPDDTVGGQLRPYAGTYYSFKPFYAPEPIGSATWSISPALPNGLTFNTSTGVISGTPTQRTLSQPYYITFTDSEITLKSSVQIVVRTGNQPLTLNNTSLAYQQTYRIPIENLIGSSQLRITSSNTGLCRLSGSNSETITAMAGSGTCNIRVVKDGSIDFNTFDRTFSISLSKSTPTLSITSNLTSPRVSGSTITLTATISGPTSGLVQFFAGDTLITGCGSSGTVSYSNSTTTCAWTPDSASGSPFALTARLLSTSNYNAATSAALNYVINPAITLSYSGSESVFGNSNTISPLVSGGTGDLTSWVWSVKRTSNSASVDGITINSVGEISVSSSLSAGTYAMTVTATDSVNVTKSAALEILVHAANPQFKILKPARSEYTAGQTVSLTANLPSDATGTVTFKYGGIDITSCGTAGAVTVSSGVATCQWDTTNISGGEYSITGEYSGGGSYTSAVSFDYTIKINLKAVFSYSNRVETFGIATSIAPAIAPNRGTGDPTDWSWGVVLRSDSSTVTGVTITSSGLIEVADTTSAGLYGLSVYAVDLAGETSTATLNLTINKAQPVLTLSARVIPNTVVYEATANRQIAWTIESTHRSSGAIKMYVNNSDISCMTSIAYSNGQCWWQSSTSGTTVSAYATFDGDSNLETATSNVITNFAINPALSLAYSDTSTYGGTATTILPTVSGGTGTRIFTLFEHITGNQLEGITIDSVTGVISIARTAIVGTYRLVASVYDVTNANAIDDNIAISILEHTAPDISLSQTSETKETNQEFSGYEVSNSASPISVFSISPDLPTGLRFNPLRGTISGSSSAVLTSRVFTLTAFNTAGSDTATFTLAVTEPTLATITLSIGTTPAAKGTANTIVATLSHAGRVEFLIDGKRVPGCAPKRATTSITCNWKPARMGSVAISARLTPTNNAISAAVASTINVGVGRRTGTR